jgi:hypothetical protein
MLWKAYLFGRNFLLEDMCTDGKRVIIGKVFDKDGVGEEKIVV